MHGKYKHSYKNNKFEIAATSWNNEFKLPDGSYSTSDIQDYFEHIFKKLSRKTEILQKETNWKH